ncbi:TPA: redoxin domain-containing protein [Candidatus Poribacteria bacterium]|nr:redoxin domain-containing protein [Candidatus Poribacteria bacterium]HEX30617.1 redoxin domain-containing protein [Candidatus Poribacteria bacterium]
MGLKIGEKAPDFLLQDVHDKDYQLSKIKADLILLIFGNRKTRKEADKWAMSVKREFGDQLKERGKLIALQVGDVSSKPFFITRSFVKKWLRRNKTILPMPLDWDGKIFKLYKVPKDRPMIYLIQDGKVVWKMASKMERGKFEKLKAAVSRFMKVPHR